MNARQKAKRYKQLYTELKDGMSVNINRLVQYTNLVPVRVAAIHDLPLITLRNDLQYEYECHQCTEEAYELLFDKVKQLCNEKRQVNGIRESICVSLIVAKEEGK